MSCSSCNEKLVEGAKFCMSCGTKVAPKMCSSCSTELMPNAKFCPECGTPTTKKEEAKTPETKVEVIAPSPELEAPKEAVDVSEPTKEVAAPEPAPIVGAKADVAEPSKTEESSEPPKQSETSVNVSEEKLVDKPIQIEVIEPKEEVPPEEAPPQTPEKKLEEVPPPQTPEKKPEEVPPPQTPEKKPEQVPQPQTPENKVEASSPSTVIETPIAAAAPSPEAMPTPEVLPASDSQKHASLVRPSGDNSSLHPQSPENLLKEEASAEKKKKFSVKESPKCHVCGKSVYEAERAVDSAGTVFHKDCLRCKTCKCSLVGRQKIEESSEVGSIKIRTGQYLVAKEGSHLARDDVVKAQVIEEKARDDQELNKIAALRKEANEEARISMQLRVGDMLPQCARCGRPIDKGQKAMTSGIQKFHESCPTKEESDKAIRTIRYFLKKHPDRLAGTFICDKETKHPHTFLFELDKDTMTNSLKKNGNEKTCIRYLPDLQARVTANRKLVPPSSQAARDFDMTFRDFFEFTFVDPRTEKVCPWKLEEKEQKLLLTKFHHANGVLQIMEIHCKYEEASKLCNIETIDISLEMWPPEAANEMSSQLDPLAHLKAQLHGENHPTVSPTKPEEKPVETKSVEAKAVEVKESAPIPSPAPVVEDKKEEKPAKRSTVAAGKKGRKSTVTEGGGGEGEKKDGCIIT